VSTSQEPKLALFELYLATAEKVSDRRAQANSWMLSVNTAIVAFYGYLEADKAVVVPPQKGVWLWAIPVAGALVSLAWIFILISYRKLNRAKFEVIQQLEKSLEADMPIPLFTREREIYRFNRRWALSYIETVIPFCFILLYATLFIVAVRNRSV
jgi:hypothetical protein